MDLCIKNLGRKRKEPPVIRNISKIIMDLCIKNLVVGKLSEFILEIPSKYNDPRNPVVTIETNVIYLSNTIINIGETINAMTIDTMHTLQLNHLRPTHTFLELEYKLVISLTGSLDYVTITLAF
jgi:hypothetical protein